MRKKQTKKGIERETYNYQMNEKLTTNNSTQRTIEF